MQACLHAGAEVIIESDSRSPLLRDIEVWLVLLALQEHEDLEELIESFLGPEGLDLAHQAVLWAADRLPSCHNSFARYTKQCNLWREPEG